MKCPLLWRLWNPFRRGLYHDWFLLGWPGKNVRTADIKYLLSFQGVCADQCKVTGHHRYQTVELNDSVLGELKKLFEAKAEHVHQTLALHSYTSVLSRLQVESYVYRLLSSSSLLRSVALQQQEQGVFAGLDCSRSWSGCPAPCAAAVLESCGGICVLEYFSSDTKNLLILCRDQWNFFLAGKSPVPLTLSPGQEKLNAGVTSAVWAIDWHWVLYRNTVWMGHPNSQSFVVQSNI